MKRVVKQMHQAVVWPLRSEGRALVPPAVVLYAPTREIAERQGLALVRRMNGGLVGRRRRYSCHSETVPVTSLRPRQWR